MITAGTKGDKHEHGEEEVLVKCRGVVANLSPAHTVFSGARLFLRSS